MKKSRFLALSLVVAVALMGAGYAYWTDTLTIENSISTGFLDVDFGSFTGTAYMDDTADEADEANVMGASFGVGTDGIDLGEQDNGEDDENDGNNDKLTVTVNNLYPNSRYEVKGDIINYSSIPVDINAINYELTGLPTENEDISEYLVMEVWVNGEELTIPVENTTEATTIVLPESMIKRMAEYNTTNDLDTMPVKVVVKLSNNAPNDTTEEVKDIKLTVAPSFKQFNGENY